MMGERETKKDNENFLFRRGEDKQISAMFHIKPFWQGGGRQTIAMTLTFTFILTTIVRLTNTLTAQSSSSLPFCYDSPGNDKSNKVTNDNFEDFSLLTSDTP